MPAKRSLMDTLQTFEKTVPAPTLEPVKPGGASSRPPSRHGKRAVTGYFSQTAFTQFKILAAELNKDGQALVEEAISDLFQKYSKPPIVRPGTHGR